MICKLNPSTQSYIWGGTKLKTLWNKNSAGDTIAESWELSFCDSSPSIINGGEHNGKPLAEVATREDWGKNCDAFHAFPTLVKLIDTQQNLSVQVHPSDDFALRNENQFGKTEMWHILDAEPDAKIFLGLNRTVTPQQFLQAVSDNSVCDLLNSVTVHAGETYFVPSGTLHAIGAGVTLIEIQQNSTLTYRVYDYGRVDANGCPRELHIDKAMQVADLQRYVVPDPHRTELLGSCKYFSAYRYKGARSWRNSGSFTSVTVIDGSIAINDVVLQKGETAFISARESVTATGDGAYVVVCVDA